MRHVGGVDAALAARDRLPGTVAAVAPGSGFETVFARFLWSWPSERADVAGLPELTLLIAAHVPVVPGCGSDNSRLAAVAPSGPESRVPRPARVTSQPERDESHHLERFCCTSRGRSA